MRIVVAGTRNYDDYEEFSRIIEEYLRERYPSEPVIFISGAAPTGADALIIRWCREHGYPWVEFPALWDKLDAPGAVIRFRKKDNKPYNVKAGYDRNEVMAQNGTNLITLWDGRSSGTADMLERADRHRLNVFTNLIDTPEKVRYVQESASRRASDPRQDREAPAW